MIENLPDSPPISNVLRRRKLQILEIPENRSFVVDLDILDPDGIEDQRYYKRRGRYGFISTF